MAAVLKAMKTDPGTARQSRCLHGPQPHEDRRRRLLDFTPVFAHTRAIFPLHIHGP